MQMLVQACLNRITLTCNTNRNTKLIQIDHFGGLLLINTKTIY